MGVGDTLLRALFCCGVFLNQARVEMERGLNMMKNHLLLSFLPLLSSFFDFGRQIFNFFPEKTQFQLSFNPSMVGMGFLIQRFYRFFESLMEASRSPQVPLIVKVIPQHAMRVRNGFGKHRKS